MKKSNWQIVLGVVIVIAAAIFIASMYIRANTEPTVAVDETTITVSGQYGASMAMADVVKVYVDDLFPANMRRTDGFESGAVRRGNFTVNGVPAKVYIFSENAPTLYVESADRIFVFNFRDGGATYDLYRKILAFRQK
jgi:hypothetical protein